MGVEIAGKFLLMLMMMWRGRNLSFSRYVLPQPEILLWGYIQRFSMFVNISRCLVIPAFPQHVRRSFLQGEHHKSDSRNAPCTAGGAHTHSKGDVIGLSCMCSPAELHKHNKLDVSQTVWKDVACSDHLCNTCTTGLMILWELDTVHELHSFWWHYSIANSEQDNDTQIQPFTGSL